MADIKNLNIFGANKGLDAIKKETNKLKEKQSRPINPTSFEHPTDENDYSFRNPRTKELVKKINTPSKKAKVGAPIRKFDRSFSAYQPIKLSAILNLTSKILTEKYMSSYTKDELLREALNTYIRKNLKEEDKLDLLQELQRDLESFRTKRPTVPQFDSNGKIIKNVETIEKETLEYLIKAWGITEL